MGNWSEWLSGFTQSTRQLLPFARAAVSDGISRTEFYNITRAAGIGARKQDVLRMMRDLQTAYKNPSQYLDQSDLTAKPIPELIPQSLGRQARNYSYVVSAELFDPVSESFYRDHVTIASSTLLDVDSAFSDAMAEWGKYGMSQNVSEGSIKIESVTRSDNPIFRT
jgi:hypothetical protein